MKKRLYDGYKSAIETGRYEIALSFVRHIYAESKSEGKEMCQRFRRSMREVMSKGGEWAKKGYDMIYESYVMCARDFFDDFMTALEFFRPPEKQFWTPRREKLLGICEALQELEDDKLDELFISQPPRTGKTTLIMFFYIWQVCRDMEGTSIYCSYTKDVAMKVYEGIIEVFTDDMTYALEEIFPTAKIASTNAEQGSINVGRKKRLSNLLMRSITAGLNGIGDASRYIVIDDIHSGIIEARNPELLLNTWQIVNNNLLSRGKDRTKILWIGTRWSIYDAISQRLELLESSEELSGRRYKVVNVPALNDDDESNFDYPFGLGFSTGKFKEIRAAFEKSDDYASFLAQYQGTPIERNGAVFDPEVLRYYNGELPSDQEPDRIIMVVDPSWGGGDFVSAPCLYQYGDDLFLHDIVFSNKDKFVTEPMIVECAVRNGVQAMYVEGTRVTGTYADELDKRLRDVGYRLNLQKTTKHWASQVGKSQRIYDKAPEIISRMIFRDSKHREKPYHQAMQQLFAFTVEGKIKHDDFPDSLAMAMVMVQGRMYAKVRAVKRFI